MPQQLGRDLGAVLLGQFLEHFFIGAGGLGLAGHLDDGQLQLLEEDAAQLGGAVEVEGFPRQGQHLGLPLPALGVHGLRKAGEDLQIHPHARALQAGQDFHQGQVHLAVEPLKLGILQALRKAVAELQGQVGILGGVLHRQVEIRLVEALLALALAHHRLEGDGSNVQVAGAQVIQVVAQARLRQEALHHAVVRQALHGQAVAGQHDEVVLEVLPGLGDGRILQQRTQHAANLGKGQVALVQVGRQVPPVGFGFALEVQQAFGQARFRQQARQGAFGVGGGGLQVRQGHIEPLVGLPGQAQAHQVAPGGLQRGGFRIQAQAPRSAAGSHCGFQVREASGAAVGPGLGRIR
ncbi:MAG: hypothetical protein BWY56_02470 [Acidobacteria bacterium ADurb.Bin340]|nr:MAG: hypothetical protein BWY56_02470 [Acidobacteria bacterium ADurb.Bin340]